MNDFTIDILEKLSNFYVLFYFVMEFLMTYSWICKELDYVTDFEKLLQFSNPIAIITGIMNIISFPLILLVLKIRISNSESLINWKSSILFYSVTIPTFLSTMVYMIMKKISSVIFLRNNKDYSIVSNVGEFFLYFGTIILINFLTRGKLLVNNLQKCFVKFVISLTLFGMINSMVFYLTAQQIENFINIASNYSPYSSFYNNEFIKQRKPNNDLISNGVYLQPITLLFCCVSGIYLILFFSGNNFKLQNNRIHNTDEFDLLIEITEESTNSVTYRNSNLTVNRSQFFKLPPLSLIVGILFIATTLIITGIADTLMNSEKYFTGQLISSIFPIPIYIFSIILLTIQINSMKQWKKLNNNENLIDKIVLWVGATGQIIECVAQIAMNFYQTDSKLMIPVIIEYCFCFFQIMFQTLMIGLLLDRQWVLPNYETWQEYICPPVGMLSLNLGFMIFSILDIVNAKSLHVSPISTNPHLFMRIFANGFQSIGVTLAILQRLHASLIFGRIIFSKYNRNI